VTTKGEARERLGLISNASRKGSDTKVTRLLDPSRAKVFTQTHPTMKGAAPRLNEDVSKEENVPYYS
jgi:hypothetical protein